MASSTGPSRSRETFADAVSNWMAKEGITMKMIHTWATDTKSSGPWNSQMHGVLKKALEPKPTFFESVAKCNKAIATDDLPLELNPDVREVFRKAKPMLDADGQVMDAGGFFSLFVGSTSPNPIYLSTDRFTNGEAELLGQFLRLLFQETAKKRFQDRQEAWQEFEPIVSQKAAEFEEEYGVLDFDMRELLHDVLAGWKAMKGSELTSLCRADEDCPVKRAFEEYTKVPMGLNIAGGLLKMEWTDIQEWVKKEVAAV